MDKTFTSCFESFKDRPIELEVEAERLLEEALETGDCDLALVAQSLGFRAMMMMQQPVSDDAWQLKLPPGCNSHYPRIQYDIANLLLQAGEPDQAESRLLSIGDAPKWASHAWNFVGMIRLEREDFEGAMRAYMKAQETASDIPNPSIYMNLGQISARANAWEDALYWFELASEAQTWNAHRNAYTFVYDIQPILDANRLRAAINANDSEAADKAWRDMWPTELTSHPVLQVRTMLDYLFWRERTELIPGVVRMYEEVVMADSAEAESILNDRVLLFEAWRNPIGWSLDRAIEILAIAEQKPAMKMMVDNVNSGHDRPLVTYNRVVWMRRIAWAGVLVVLGVGVWELSQIAQGTLARRRAERQENGVLLDGLVAVGREQMGATERWGAAMVLASRLKKIDVENVIPEHLFNRLNAREIQMLRWILVGHSSQNIADELNVSVQYVYNMRSELRRKLDLKPGEDWNTLQTLES